MMLNTLYASIISAKPLYACYAGKDEEKFYQYTLIDEASRERFIYPYREQSGSSAADFVKSAITYFGYAPKMIQTDNGAEFTNFSRTKRIHITANDSDNRCLP